MTTPGTPETEEQAKMRALVAQLPPEFATYFNSGTPNPAIVNIALQSPNPVEFYRAIQKNGLGSFLPPFCQQELSAFEEKERKAREDEEKFERRTAASLLFAVGAMGAAKAMADEPMPTGYYGNSKGYSAADRAMWDNYSNAELAQMSYADWSKLTEGQKNGLIAKTAEDAETAVNNSSATLGDEMKKIKAELMAKGMSADQADKELGKLLDAATNTHSTDIKFWDKEGQAIIEKNMENLSPEGREQAQRLNKAYAAVGHGFDAKGSIAEAQKPDADDPTRFRSSGDANASIVKSTNDLNSINGQNLTAEQIKEAGKQTVAADGALTELGDRTTVSLADAKAGQQAGTYNVTAGASVDSGVVAAANKPKAEDDFGESAPTQVAATAPAQPVTQNKSINIPGDPPIVSPDSPLLAQLGAPANETSTPEPEKLRPATPSASASGGAGMSA